MIGSCANLCPGLLTDGYDSGILVGVSQCLFKRKSWKGRGTMTPEQWMLALAVASVIGGEAGIVPEAMPMVAHSIMNRVDSAGWPNDAIGVIEEEWQYNGRAKPSVLTMSVALQVLNRTSDPTGGVLFVLSGQDRQKLECGIGDMIYVSPAGSVHGYRDWCGR